MIVDPDFLDHWRTRLLSDLLNQDPLAPIYLLRLWAHCQSRRTARFENLSDTAIKAICRYQGDKDLLEKSLIECGFIEREATILIVSKWEEYNATLFANWENGKRGGRPKKTQSKPMGFPSVTHGQPMANPNETHGEPIREDKIYYSHNTSYYSNNSDSQKKSSGLVHFAKFWETYPNRAGKAACEKKWKAGHLDEIAETIIADVNAKKAQQWEPGFIPTSLTYINQQRWRDPVQLKIKPPSQASPTSNTLKAINKLEEMRHAIRAKFESNITPMAVRSLLGGDQETITIASGGAALSRSD